MSSERAGVIWCPGYDAVLKWTQETQGKELTDDAIDHLRSAHGFGGPRLLKEPGHVV